MKNCIFFISLFLCFVNFQIVSAGTHATLKEDWYSSLNEEFNRSLVVEIKTQVETEPMDKTYNLSDGDIELYGSFNEEDSVLTLTTKDSVILFPENSSYIFANMKNLRSIDMRFFRSDSVKNMAGIFTSCKALTSLDLSRFKTDSATNMNNMFVECISLDSINVSHFNTSNVESMSSMFQYCSKLKKLDLSAFNTSNLSSI